MINIDQQVKEYDWVTIPGLLPYQQGLQIMQNKVEEIITERSGETIFLLEHEEVYTAGTGFKEGELLSPGDIPVFYTGRGGKLTYHGPGQRIIYPILNLENRGKDIKHFVHNLEKWIIGTLKVIGIKAYTIENKVGIWVDDSHTCAKIAAIGIRLRKWVSFHGIAVNISTNLDRFSGIIPCGISNFPVTSIEELGIKISNRNFDLILKQEFSKLLWAK